MVIESVTGEDLDEVYMDLVTPASWDELENAKESIVARGYEVTKVRADSSVLRIFGKKAKPTSVTEAIEATQGPDGTLVD